MRLTEKILKYKSNKIVINNNLQMTFVDSSNMCVDFYLTIIKIS